MRDGLGFLARRDSPFRLRPRPALLPWLARFGAAALPRRSARGDRRAARARRRPASQLHEGLVRAGLPTGFARRGTLSVFESARGLERARAGAPGASFLGADEARALEPALAPGIAGARLHPDDAHCDPGALVGALLDAAAQQGADVRTGVEMLRLRRTNGRIAALDTTAGPLAAGTVVLAAGTWSRELARDVGVHVPLEAAKGYHVEVATRRAGRRHPGLHGGGARDRDAARRPRCGSPGRSSSPDWTSRGPGPPRRRWRAPPRAR